MSWLFTLFLKWRDRHDPAWQPTGIAQKFDGFDPSKAVQAAQRAKELSERRRTLELARGGQLKPARGLKKVEHINARRRVNG